MSAAEALRTSIREMIRDSGLKQVFIADRLGTTPKHMSHLLSGRVAMTVDWAAKIADVCRQPLRLNIDPTEWAVDVATWRERAEQAEAHVQRVQAYARWCDQHDVEPEVQAINAVLDGTDTYPYGDHVDQPKES